MIFVYSVIYYHSKGYAIDNVHEIREHKFEKIEDAIQVVAEIWVDEPNNAYTIIDEGD